MLLGLTPLRGRLTSGSAVDIGVPEPPAPSRESARRRYLRWLTRQDGSLMAAQNPAATGGVLRADPFLAPGVLAVAAAIEPGEWQRGGGTRSFARRLGADLVPDDIRLRTRRGPRAGTPGS